MVSIYILSLENNKYYIGKSHNPNDRIMEHLDGKGSQFTKLYKPKKLIEIISDSDDYDEDKYTLQYMDKYGIENVRGGSFSQIEFTHEDIKRIKRMIYNAQNRCFICGSKDHFANNCNNKKYCYICENDSHNSRECKSKEKCYCLSSFLFVHSEHKCIQKNGFNIFKYF